MMPKKDEVDERGRTQLTTWDDPALRIKRFKRDSRGKIEEGGKCSECGKKQSVTGARRFNHGIKTYDKSYREWLEEEARRFGNTEIKTSDGTISLWVADPIPQHKQIIDDFWDQL